MIETHVLNCHKLINKLKESKSFLKRCFKIVLIKYYSFVLKYFFGSFISHNAKLGSGLCFPHSFHGIFISQNAIVGDNVTILHHVTIGSNMSKTEGIYEAPIIEDDVFIGCNACIIGKTVVGRGSKVGAGAVLTNKKILSDTTLYVDNIKFVDKK